jgi:glycosyltransferase involved in cell wall biosynthesis
MSGTAEIPSQARTSAIVTCHNYGRYLKCCLDSLLAQTLPFHEIIVIDDDSSDDTPVIARGYGGKIRYERVAFRNVCLAREHAVNLSTGEFLVMVDADDWIAPAYHETLIAPMLEDGGLALVYCGLEILYETDEDRRWCQSREAPMVPFDPLKLRLFNFIPQTSLVRRRAWLGQDPSLPHLVDWDHWLRIVREGGRARLVPERLAGYRIHRQSSTHTLLEHYGWSLHDRVRERACDHELTILTLFSGRGNILDPYLEALRRLKKPAKTQCLFIDNSAQPYFRNRLQASGADVIPLGSPLEFRAKENFRTETRQAISRHCASLYEAAKPYVRGRKLLLWEHDVIPPPHAYERLDEHAWRLKADLISGTLLGRESAEFMAWRLMGGDPGEELYPVSVSTRPKRVFATAFGFLLLDTSLFWRMPLETEMAGSPRFGYDVNAGLWGWQRGLRWFVDGSVRCRHLDPAQEGRPVRRGGPANALIGRYASMREGTLL